MCGYISLDVRVEANFVCSSCRACCCHALPTFDLGPTRRFIVFRQLSAGFTSDSEAVAHGSILMVGAMLNHGDTFMMPRYDETCHAVMKLKEKHGQ